MTVELKDVLSAAGGALNIDLAGQYVTPLQRIANEPMPIVTLSSSALSGGTTLYPYNNAGSSFNNYFGYPGTPAQNVIKAGFTTPQYNYVTAAIQAQNTFSHRPFMTSFTHTGKSLDLIQYGATDDVTIYVDGKFLGRYRPALATGTAQAGTATTVTLASGSNSVDGYYNGYWVRITGGTGALNEARQIVGYVGSTKVATVSSVWTTTPDATTTYTIQDANYPFVLDGNTGSVKFLQLRWPTESTRTIQVVSGYWCGVVSDYNTIQPASGWGAMPLIVVGDSFWEGQERPAFLPRMLEVLALNLHMQPVNLSAGSTGPVAYFSNRLPFSDRIAPPNEAWYVSKGGTAGTFTLSVTYNGVTSTTSAIGYNANATTVAAALEALSNMSSVSTYPAGEKWHVSGGDFGSPFVILSKNIPGATVTIDASSITGTMAISQYYGDLIRSVPKDTNGNSLPFILLIPGSGNDTVYYNTGTYGTAVPDAISYISSAIKTKFPTAIPIVMGTTGYATVGYDTISTGANAQEQVLLGAWRASSLPTIHGREPVIPILGAVGDPLPLNISRDNLKSRTNVGHPTSLGMQYFAELVLNKIRSLLWGRA